MHVDPNRFLELTQKSHATVDRGPYSVTIEHTTTQKVDAVSGHVLSVQNNTYEKPTVDAKEEIQELAGLAAGSAEARQKEMAVLSNAMSEEDYQKYRENGGSLSDVDSAEIVTVVDKIKIHLAESGVDVGKITAGKEAIESISNGRVTTEQASAVLTGADLPATNENVSDLKKAFELASSLTEFSDGAVKYMTDNRLPAEIENLYRAQNGAGAGFGLNVMPDAVAEEMRPQMEQMIEECGLPVTEDTLANSRWMIANEIPLNEENLVRVDTLKKMALPFEKEQILTAITDAITEGKRPQEAKMLDFVTAKRTLEETRLAMTEDANRSLLKKGMEVDTTALRETVEQLKEQERTFYERLLSESGQEADEVSIHALKETVDKIDEIRYLPAYTLSIPEADTKTLSGIREAGQSLKVKMDQAGERYETMQTEIRRDLGDSIKKAFRNVDSLLEDLDLAQTEANERAVRILSYNHMEVTADSVLAMKAKDEEVQRALKALTPSVVAHMVKNNQNPLDQNLTDLTKEAEVLKKEFGIREEDRFGEYLYKLEHNNRISEAERESYVGIFRLIKQIEKTDGAVIGAVVHQGGELTMKSLLTALRSSKKGAMDYRVDDDFGGVAGKTTGKDILSQIQTAFDETAYQTNVMRDIAEEMSPEAFRTLMKNDANWENQTPEQFLEHLRDADTADESAQFVRDQMEQLAQAADTEQQVYRMMEQFDVPNTMANVLAIKQMMEYPNVAIRRLFGRPVENYRDENGEVDFQEVKNSLLKEFGEAVSEPEELAEAQKKLADVAENVMKTMLASEDKTTTELDVKSLKMAMNRFQIAGKMAEKEQYHIPVLVRGETGEINLKIVSGTEKKGIIDIMFSLSSLGSVAAKLKVEDGKVSGFVASDRQEMADLFYEKGSDLLAALTSVEGIQAVNVNPIHDEKLELPKFSAATDTENEAYLKANGKTAENRTPTRVLYQVAKSFLSVLSSF